MNDTHQPEGLVSDSDLDDVLAAADAAYTDAPADSTPAEPATPAAPAADAPATPATPAAVPAQRNATQPAQPAAPTQAGPPWWQNVKDYKSFEEALPTAPPEVKEMLDYIADTVLKPHYQDLTAALERNDAAAKQWESLVAEAKTKGIDTAAAERVQKLTADIEASQQAVQAAEAKVAAYGNEYSAVVRDSFVAMCPDFKANTPIGEAFLASMAAGKHIPYMKDGVSEATALARLWRAMVPAPAPATAAPAAAPQPASATRIAAASRGTRPAAPSIRAPQQQSDEDIFREADLAFPVRQ